MIESRRRAYLEAIGLDVWSIKPPEPEFDRLLFQPGSGSTLLICDSPDATATRIAGDISRALGGEVVWAWPDPEGDPQSLTLEQAVDQYLFTRVVLFGTGLGRRMFRSGAPLVAGSAGVTVTDKLDELAVRGSTKQVFWKQLSGMSIN
jgi:hypothetical protein